MESGWTSQICVERLGLSKGAISQYRNGITRPSLQVLRLFSALSGVPLALPGEKPLGKGGITLTDQEERILNLVRGFGPAQRSAIASMLTSLADAAAPDGSGPPTSTADPVVHAVALDAVQNAVLASESGKPATAGGASKRSAAEERKTKPAARASRAKG